MEDNTRNNKELKKIKDLVTHLSEMGKDDLVTFLEVRAKKDQEFLVDLLTHFASQIDDEEDAQGTVLKFIYGKILKKQSSKIDKDVRQLFSVIKTLQAQVGDYIALEDNLNAFRLLKSMIYFSSKTLYKLETYRNLLIIHIHSFRLLELVIDQTKAPVLQEQIHDYLKDLVSSFYYLPYDPDYNAIRLLEKTEKYGGDILELLENKEKEISDQGSKLILHYLLFNRYLNNPKYQEKLIELCKQYIYHVDFLDYVSQKTKEEGGPDALLEYYTRLLKGVRKPHFARLYYLIVLHLAKGGKGDSNFNEAIKNYLSQFYEEGDLDILEELSGKQFKKITNQILKTIDSNDWKQKALQLRLKIYLNYKKEEIFSDWQNDLNARQIELFLQDFYAESPEEVESILYEFLSAQIETKLGHHSIVWTQDILDLVRRKASPKLSHRLRERVAKEYEHRKQFSKTLLT